MMRRAIGGFLTALILGAVLTHSVGWTPICATFTEGSVEWYMFFCFVDPPPKDPQGG